MTFTWPISAKLTQKLFCLEHLAGTKFHENPLSPILGHRQAGGRSLHVRYFYFAKKKRLKPLLSVAQLQPYIQTWAKKNTNTYRLQKLRQYQLLLEYIFLASFHRLSVFTHTHSYTNISAATTHNMQPTFRKLGGGLYLSDSRTWPFTRILRDYFLSVQVSAALTT